MIINPKVTIDIWGDYVCPFCYLEMPITDRLQTHFEEDILIEWHAFELRPDPVPSLNPDGEYLHRVWGESVYPMAEDRGLKLKLPPVQPRSRKAFEATAFARDQDMATLMHRAIFHSFFAEGRNIGSIDVLVDIGSNLGLDADQLQAALVGNLHTARVLKDEAMAEQLGITAVPTMLIRRADEPIENAARVSGAVAYEPIHDVVMEILNRAN
jgi:predicted DsbA family dithiol-disulfide isomerase